MSNRWLPVVLGLGLLLSIPLHPVNVQAQAAICGPFTDVLASDVFCPFILQAFNLGVTNGTGNGTTFSPNDTIPRNQVVTFFDRGVDFVLHRGRRTAIGRTWTPTAASSGASLDVGGPVADIVSDGQFLWVATGSDSSILKVSAADRHILETWHITTGQLPAKLGIYAGLVWITDLNGGLYFLDPAQAPSTRAAILSGATGASPGFPAMSFDGRNVWFGSNGGNRLVTYEVGGSAPVIFPSNSSTSGLAFDGTFMWLLLGNGHLFKLNIGTPGVAPRVIEDITLPEGVADCRMVWDGNNLWIPAINAGRVLVVRPAQGSFKSQVVLNQVLPETGLPYVASFDGETVMIGGFGNGTVSLFKASSLTLLRTFNTGAVAIRGIASDGLTFTVGDAILGGTKIFQF